VVKLIVVETLRGRKVIAVSAARRRTVTIGRARLTLTNGGSATLRLVLNQAGRRLLARFHRFKAELVVSQSGTVVFTRILRL
jgi:hypothetical protein